MSPQSRRIRPAGRKTNYHIKRAGIARHDGRRTNFGWLRKRSNVSYQPQANGQATAANQQQTDPKKGGDDEKDRARKVIRFEIKTSDSIQTDFMEAEPLQWVVRISPNGRLMTTGGTDGHSRLWNFLKMTMLSDISAHTKEIDDLDFSPDSKYIVSIAKDGLGVIWSIHLDKESRKLTWNPPEGTRYLFKRCRYGLIEGHKDKHRLFTLANPFSKAGVVEIDESLAALAVRDDGRFVAVGTMFSGSVLIYIAFSLQWMLHIPNAHAMFMTGLEFLPVTNFDGPAISANSEAAVLSISVDNRVCVHSLQW